MHTSPPPKPTKSCLPIPTPFNPLSIRNKPRNRIWVHIHIIRVPGHAPPINLDHALTPDRTQTVKPDIITALNRHHLALTILRTPQVRTRRAITVEKRVKAGPVYKNRVRIQDPEPERVAIAGAEARRGIVRVVQRRVEREWLADGIGGGLPVGRLGLHEAREHRIGVGELVLV